MNLEKMGKMQAEFDEFVIKEKKIEWTPQERLFNTTTSLISELSEFANEGRWFKVWSKNRQPNTSEKIECFACNGTGDENYEMVQEDAEGNGRHEYIQCEDCNGTGYNGEKNPVLEEFADGIHYFLSIANQMSWQERLYIHEDAIEDLREQGFDGGLNGAFLEMNYLLLSSILETKRNPHIERSLGMTLQEFQFRSAWFVFIGMGMIAFNFTPEELEQAYMDKHEVNYRRQKNGY